MKLTTYSIAACLAAGLAVAVAHAASVLQVSAKGGIPGAPEEIWKKVGGFCAIQDWHPAVAKCEETADGADTFRTLTLGDGGVIKEKLTGKEDTSYRYTIIESPLPVKDYNAVFTVRPNFDNKSESHVVWSSSFQAKGKPDGEAKSTIQGIFDAGLKSIEEKHGG